MAELEAEAEATVTEKGELQAMTDLQAGQMEDLKQELEKLRVMLLQCFGIGNKLLLILWHPVGK